MKKIYLLATALAALVSCTSDDFTGEKEPMDANGKAAISFDLNTPAVTRENKTGSDAADDLGNYFIIYGEKGETAETKYTDGNLVFPNYTVHYTASSAYTTTSNTKNWEYVGVTPISTTHVKMTDGGTSETAPEDQTIKYWDYGAASYTFTAVSAKKEDIAAGRVTIQKNTVGDNVYQKGYTITLAKSGTEGSYIYPTLNELFFADRKVISHTTGTDRNATDAYGGNVTMQFRNFMSHVRAGVYETIPGYDITSITFFVNTTAETPAQTLEAKVGDTSAFGAVCPNIPTTNYEGTLTVTYYNSGDVQNQPNVTVSGSTTDNLILGTNMSGLSTTSLLGKTATAPSWDKALGAFTEVMPQINNDKDLVLKCNYTLWNSVTHETITIESATARVPAMYLQWKPNFKYTYLFKISDNTDGSSGTPGTDPAGLYPITFDAVEVVAEDGQAEYITTVSEPSITTFGVIVDNGSKFKNYVTEKNEYQIPTGTDKLDIYAAIMEGTTLVTPAVGTNVNVYKVTTTDATNFPITEASVAEAIAANKSNAMNVDIYTYDGTSTYTKVTDASTLDASTTYYKAYNDGTSDIVPGGTGYVQTIAVADVDYVIVKIKATNINSDATDNFSAIPAAVTTVPGEDGIDITNTHALKLTGVKVAGTYAIEYEASTEWTGSYKKVYKVIVVQ